MSLTHSNSIRTSACQVVRDALYEGGSPLFKILNSSDEELASFTVEFNLVTSGSMSLSGTPVEFTVDQDGIGSTFELCKNDGEVVYEGIIGTDLTVSDNAFYTSIGGRIDNYTYTMFD
jgi:hypothetical protein